MDSSSQLVGNDPKVSEERNLNSLDKMKVGKAQHRKAIMPDRNVDDAEEPGVAGLSDTTKVISWIDEEIFVRCEYCNR